MNLFWLVLAVLGGGAALLIARHDAGTVLGIENDTFASVLFLSVWLAVLSAGILPRRGEWRQAARNFALWVGIFLIAMSAYLYRYELQDFGSRLSGGLIPGSPVSLTSADGRQRAVLFQSNGGHFEARGSIDGAPIRFLVDTGASNIVLTADDARRAGINVDTLSYTVPVSTANGRTTAARARIGEVAIGAIARDNAQVLVARDGALDTSLLGMSFLNSLTSFEFRGDRLILTD
jgi:aspartyl protease family protein